MLVLEVVTATIAFLIAGVSGQEPRTLGGSTSPATYANHPEVYPDLGAHVEVAGVGDIDYRRNDIFGKDLDSEENSDEYDEDYNEDEESSEKEADLSEEENKDEDRKERFKRKIIFRGGGGGGIYARGGGRRGHSGYGGDEDPYGRRRGGGYGGQGPSDSWPYRRQDNPHHETAHNTPSTTKSTTRSESTPVYGTTRRIANEGEPKSSSSSSTSSSTTSNASNKRSKTQRRESPKTKLTKAMKTEIAQFALQHGPQRAADHFEARIGRKLRVKKIEKFMRKHQSNQ